jgi:hypothetical protein
MLTKIAHLYKAANKLVSITVDDEYPQYDEFIAAHREYYSLPVSSPLYTSVRNSLWSHMKAYEAFRSSHDDILAD